MPHIEAYAYSPGGSEPKFAATNQLRVNTGSGWVGAQLAAPLPFSAALDAWRTQIASLAGYAWTLSYDAATRRVSITCTHAFELDLPGSLAAFLGFAATTYGSASARTAEHPPAGRVELLGIDHEPPEDAADTSTIELRHGRAQVTLFGNHQLVNMRLVCCASWLPSMAWVQTGRVRVYPTSDAAPYDPTAHPGGYVDGHVRELGGYDVLGDAEEMHDLSLVLSTPR